MSFETTITHRIMEYFNGINKAIVEKVKGGAECSGRADINGCYYGWSMRIEVKTPDNRNKPTKKQLYNLYQWNKAGALCMVVYSLDAVSHAINRFDNLFMETEKLSWETYNEKNKCKSLILYPYSEITLEKLYGVYYNDIQILD